MKKVSKPKIEISIITPCYNEQENVAICANELRKIMKSNLKGITYEHIFVDNSSTDETFDKLLLIAKKDKRIKLIKNSRNVGSFNNVWIGMKHCSGKYIVPSLAADLQDPPSLIPKMYRTLKSKKLLMVYAIMSNREESFFLKKLRSAYYYLINKFADSYIPRNSGEFLIADSRVVNSILATNDYYPYVRGLFAQTRVKSASVQYVRLRRARGKSGESFYTLINHALNGFISTSKLLSRLILLIGILVSSISILMALFNFMSFVSNEGDTTISGIPTLLITVFFFSGLHLLFLGFSAEYIQAIYRQVRQEPPSFVLDKINFK